MKTYNPISQSLQSQQISLNTGDLQIIQVHTAIFLSDYHLVFKSNLYSFVSFNIDVYFSMIPCKLGFQKFLTLARPVVLVTLC